MRKGKIKKYEGFSLIEMLLTIAILGVVMLISAATLTSLIKVSSVSSNKIRARNESEFVLELIRRTVRNSDPSDVFIFDSEEARTYDIDTEQFTNNSLYNIEEIYGNMVAENDMGNEIHFRPYGYRDWICIGFFKSTTNPDEGYIIRTSANDLYNNHESCFGGNSPYLMVLNSDYVNINNFNISYTQSSDTNYMIRFDIESEPIDWYLGKDSPISRSVFRQGVVSTEGLIW